MATLATWALNILMLVLLADGAKEDIDPLDNVRLTGTQEVVQQIVALGEAVASFLPEISAIDAELKRDQRLWDDSFHADFCVPQISKFESLQVKAAASATTAEHIESEVKVMSNAEEAIGVYHEGLAAGVTAQLCLLEALAMYNKAEDRMLADLEFSYKVKTRAHADKLADMLIASEKSLARATSLVGLSEKLTNADKDSSHEEANRDALRVARDTLKAMDAGRRAVESERWKALSDIDLYPEYNLRQRLKSCYSEVVDDIKMSVKKAQNAVQKAKNKVEQLARAAGMDLPEWFYDDALDSGGDGYGGGGGGYGGGYGGSYYEVDNPDGFRVGKWLSIWRWVYYG